MAASLQVEMSAVPSYDIERAWPKLLPLVEKGLEKFPEMSADTLKSMLIHSEAQAWISYLGADLKVLLITKIEQYTYVRVCLVYFLAGEDLVESMPFFENVEAWAANLGCARIRCYARKGLRKFLDGYKEQAVVLVKDL